MRKNTLLTGFPGCGKSTIIEKVVQRIDLPVTGFYTREMRDRGGRRVGFSITTLDGKHGTLAHVDIRGPTRVGRYGVNLRDIDRIAVPSIMPAIKNVIVIIDEIGKMECLSALFRRTLTKALNSANTVVGSIALKGDAFMEAVKKRPDSRLITVSTKNRDALVEEISRMLHVGATGSSG